MKNDLYKCLFVLLIVNLFPQTVVAFEEEHEAHEHGHATLMLVQEKDELQILFKSPAANIVGFEHQPNSTEQREKVEAAEALLNDADKLFHLNDEAKCSLEHAGVKSALLEEGRHEMHHSDHDHAAHHKDEHGDHHEDEHGKHHDDDHHQHHAEHEGTHSEFEVEYHFECAKMSALTELKLNLFKYFSSLEEIEAQLILKSAQRLQKLDHHNESIKF